MFYLDVQISVIRKKMCASTLGSANVWSQNKQIKQSNFPPIEVVGRGSETQFQVGDNLYKLN